MELKNKITVGVVAVILSLNLFSICSEAATVDLVPVNKGNIGYDNEIGFCKSVTTERTMGSGLTMEQQGYRITLINKSNGGNQVECILDIVSSDSNPKNDCGICTASYGFTNNQRYDIDELTGHNSIRNIFLGASAVEDAVTGDDSLIGLQDTLCNAYNQIQGQCKLYYIENESTRYLDAPNSFMFSNTYFCSNCHVVTQSDLEAAGYKIKNSKDFWFFSEQIIDGKVYKVADFYGKSEVSSPQFMMALMKLFKKNWSDFDENNLAVYEFIFEPIIWIKGVNVEGDSASGETNYGIAYSFYGTLTELAFIQSDSKGWENVIGFVCINKPYDDTVRSGCWLNDCQIIAFVDGAAMMMRENGNLAGILTDTSAEFYDKYGTDAISSSIGTDVYYCRSSYVINNMAVAVIKYNPPLTYTAMDYEYRTGTEVVSSIKITNNSREDYLPYEDEMVTGNVPVALGVMLEYTHEDGSPVEKSAIAEMGLPEFVSIQGVGSEVNFGYEQNDVFEHTPMNETYLYFKWKTPEQPMKLNVTARFVGDSKKSPVFIRPSEQSIQGELLQYTGADAEAYGNEYVTVSFSCDITDTMTKIRSENQPPDVVGGFIGSESMTEAQRKKYAKSTSVYNDYDETAAFDMKPLLEDDTMPERIKMLGWAEFNAVSDENGLHLEIEKYRADSWLEQTLTDSLKIFDYVPKDTVNESGRSIISIPSGYGFSFMDTYEYTGGQFSVAMKEYDTIKNSCTLYQNGIMLFPEFNYSSDYVRTIDALIDYDENEATFDYMYVLDNNIYSKAESHKIEEVDSEDDIKSRVHFIPLWFPDNCDYKVTVLMFDYWTPAGQIYDFRTYDLRIDGNVYDMWYASKSDVNQKK